MRAVPGAAFRRNASLAGLLFALAALLAGCDSCGDFLSPFHAEACRQQAPQQR